MPARPNYKLIDRPSFAAGAGPWKGYEHFQDETKMEFDRLTYPSRNCSIPIFDKVIPDKGKTLLGQAYTENVGINGNQQKFKNMGGIEMEVRTWPSGDANLKDVIQVLYNGSWLQITENTNPLPRGVHEVYFDEWFDTNLDASLSKKIPRLIWVNGYEDTTTHTGIVFSWTGGIAVLTNVTATNLEIDITTTWRSLGFTEDAAGNAYVVVNGVSYTLTTPADLDTNSINVTSTAGASIGDIATARIETSISPIPFDMCRQNKGYMFYGNWKSRDLYMSNAFNRQSNYTISAFAGGLLNDLVVDAGSNLYTGTTESIFHIVIDAVFPDINEQIFISGGQGNQDNAVYDTSAYSGTAGARNVYNVRIIGDALLGIPDYTQFNIGDTIRGTTSNALAIVVALMPIGGGPSAFMGIKMLTATRFITFENVDNTTTLTLGIGIGTADNSNWFEYSKNGVIVNTNVGFGSFPANYVAINTPITLSDGLTITFSDSIGTNSGTGATVGDTFKLNIRQGGIDTFKWQKDGGAFSGSIAITTAFQALSDGVQIKFLNFNGHTIGDYWDITAIPNVGSQVGTKPAYNNFYYALPVRRPGEGYRYRLPSNFWTMDTQEESMYINGSYGEWSVVSTVLSGDLLSEDVSLTPLKQAGALKVIFPYMTGHINDELIYVSIDKRLNTLGRQKFLEKPQSGYLSQLVDKDFQASTFEGGRIKYLDKTLFVSSPVEGITHCYDTYHEYWNPPKMFPEVGLLSIVGNDLVCHSNTRNQTFTMFTNNAGDNGMGYTVEIRTPYIAPNGRWNSTFSSMSFTEGYITGNPKLTHTVYLGVNGCGGIFPHDIDPIICLAPDRAPFGEGPFGSHSFGSDLDVQGSYFNEIYKRFAPVLQYYFISIGISCTAKSHTWSILGLGMNTMDSPTGNNSLVNPQNLAINNI